LEAFIILVIHTPMWHQPCCGKGVAIVHSSHLEK